MKLRIISDLHLEGFIGQSIETLSARFIPKTEFDHEQTLVLAGDICSKSFTLFKFIKEVASRFKHVFFVPGNHEFYRNTFSSWEEDAKEALDELQNVSWVNGREVKSFIYEGHTFVLGTLWGDGGYTPLDSYAVHNALNDFRLIGTGVDEELEFIKFSVGDMIQLYQKQSLQIKQYVELSEKPVIVITHHLPSRLLVSERFKANGEGINGGFVGCCESWLQYKNPKLWIHGHTHDYINTELEEFGGMKVICNPLGYRGEWNNGFSNGGVVIYEGV